MRKKIALLVGEVTGNYQEIITRSIAGRANEMGYDLVTFCTYGSYNDDVLFSEGEKACTSLPDYPSYSGVIVTEDVFDVDGMGDEVYGRLMKLAKCPVVYLRTMREGCYSVLVENKEPIKQITKHFLEKHGFTDICYMSGKRELWDAKQRLEGFMEAMEESRITVTEHMIFQGDYWREKGHAAVEWFMEGRETYPQAIICANDYMALSVCEELRERGVRVPEDVCISGFDYVEEARVYQPSITSVRVDFYEMAQKAVDIIDRVNRGLPQEKITWMQPDIMLHKSCGCGDQWVFEDVAGMLDKNYEQIATMKNIMLSTIEYQDAFEEREYLGIAEKYFDIFRCDKVWLCLCDIDEEGFSMVENESRYTNQMLLKRIFHKGASAEKMNVPFDRKDLLPKRFLKEDEPNNLLVFSVHFKNKIYGYFVAELPENDWCDIHTQAYIINLASAIENSMVQKELSSFEEIKALYQRDSLTGIYNRRGLDKFGRELYERAMEEGFNLSAVSIDMDGLKFINDHYGHSAGDKAIRKLAEILQKSMREGEICARVGGDEFSAVLLTDQPNREQEFLIEFQAAIDEANQMEPLYKIGASVGIANTRSEATKSIMACVQLADMLMYQNKRDRKAKANQ